MLNAFKLIPALQVIFKSEIEFKPDSFVDLTEAQQKAFAEKVGDLGERVYRVVPIEPTVIDRQGNERITVELNIVTESEKALMLKAVEFVYVASSEMSEPKPTFAERLAYLRPRLPPIVIGEEGD